MAAHKEDSMGKISVGRVALGGIAGGCAIMGAHIAGGYEVVQAGRETAIMVSVGSVHGFWGHASEFVLGFLVSWLYAAIRPRLGAGPRTAIVAGLVAWLIGYVFPWLRMAPLIPLRWLAGGAVILLWALVGCVVAGWLAGWIYRERGPARR